MNAPRSSSRYRWSSAGEVFAAFLKLGVSAFGGPLAHLGYFREEFVVRRGWLDDEAYSQVVALCQILPGPASSQVGIILGVFRAGPLGGLAAWAAFAFPSAVMLTLFALGIARFSTSTIQPWIHGLLVAAVAVVALAVMSMATSLCPDRPRRTMALSSAAIVLLSPVSGIVQLVLITLGALIGLRFLRTVDDAGGEAVERPRVTPQARRTAIACAVAFVVLLGASIAVPGGALPAPAIVFAKFFESGALVFGGGHVVLPLLQARVLPPHWLTADTFLAGYGAAQAVPGPLFTFAAFLGAAMQPVHGWSGAALCLVAIYLPSFLLIGAVLPFWQHLRASTCAATALHGVNAVVVGILLAALYNPIWTSAIQAPRDVALALVAFLLLAVWRTPPWIVVVLSSFTGYALAR